MKQIEKWIEKNPNIVQEYFKEDDGCFRDSKGRPLMGIWVYLEDGYICQHMECGTIHESNQKDVLEMLKTVEYVGTDNDDDEVEPPLDDDRLCVLYATLEKLNQNHDRLYQKIDESLEAGNDKSANYWQDKATMTYEHILDIHEEIETINKGKK